MLQLSVLACQAAIHFRLAMPGMAPTQDLKQAMPELARGLQQLLDFDGDVEATFARNFEARPIFLGSSASLSLSEAMHCESGSPQHADLIVARVFRRAHLQGLACAEACMALWAWLRCQRVFKLSP
jgi:hypothetical protein